MTDKLYISYPGIFCSAGTSAEELWNNVLNGNQDNIKKTTAANGKEFYAARIDDSLLSPAGCRYDMKIIRILDKALRQIRPAVDAAIEKFGAEKIAICIGSCDNGSEFSVKGHRKYFSDGTFPTDYSLEIQGADYPATFIAEETGIKGPAFVCSTACSSSGTAIIKAKQLIEAGIVEAAIAGGVDIASDTVLIGFDALESVSESIANPFSRNRNGITLGEAAALFFITKDKETALTAVPDGLKDRIPSGAYEIQILGSGQSSDASHMTAPLADGSGAESAMKAAFADAGLEPADIDYLNLHGTGTRLNDAMESRAVYSCYGKRTDTLPVSSTKSITGHTLGAAAALELALCYLSVANNTGKDGSLLPPHVYDGQNDPELPELKFVSLGNEIKKKTRICMSNSFAFGGCNISIIIGKKNG